MKALKRNRNALIFIAFLLLGGWIHTLRVWRAGWFFLETVLFVITLCIYAGLVIFWIQSVSRRLLPSRARRYMIASGIMMILFLILRTLKYRIVRGPFLIRFCWYFFYVPIVLVPVLFLLFCMEITGFRERRPAVEQALLIPNVLLILGILTNNLHALAFRPLGDMDLLTGENGTYTYGILYYLVYASAALMIAAGIFLLFRFTFRQKRFRQMAGPFFFLILIPFMILMHRTLQTLGIVTPWELPEIIVFCFLGAFEACFRSGLVPHNENYVGYFSRLAFPVLITDRQFVPVFRTSLPVDASGEQLQESLSAPVYPQGDIRLTGMEIAAGYAFWEEDETELHRANDALEEANEEIGLENRLIQYENEWKEERARIDVRTAVYEKAAACVLPVQKRLEAMLDEAEPGTPAFRETVAKASLLNAYVKRRSNFVLSFSEGETIPSAELTLAIDEMVRFLEYGGVSGAVECRTDTDFSFQTAADLFDSFEIVLEALLPRISRVMTVIRADGLRLTADPDGPWELPELPLPAAAFTEEGYLYVDIRAERGDAK